MTSDSGGFGDLLRGYRKAAGLTQEELADRAGLSPDAISTLERGTRQAPRRDTVQLLAEALGLSGQEYAGFKVAAHRRTARADTVKSSAADLSNLPLQPTRFIGRERELELVASTLANPDTRLVTLTGAGGTGKTRLALQAAADALDDYGDGVFFVDLAPITEPSLVPSTIARALGVTESGGRSLLDALKEDLRGKQVLLLLDNFEQVVESAPVVSELLAAAPDINVMVTSRMPLRLRGEREYQVPPLSLPEPDRSPDPDTLHEYDAVRLFIERARDVRPDFELSSENAPAVAEICYRLDGLPLAVELAAVRVKLFPPQALLARLSNRLGLLTRGARDASLRQRTLRGTIDWSHDLLTRDERSLFAMLGVFAGGRSFEAIEAVCDPGGQLDLLDTLQSLVDQSLLRQEEGVGGEPRFLMLETINEYALERLEESGDAEELRRRHAGYFLSLAERVKPDLRDAIWHFEPLERLEEEHDNLRAALSWLHEHGEVETALRLGVALGWFWTLHSHEAEGRTWLERCLADPGPLPVPIRAEAYYHLGRLALDDSSPAAEGLLQEALGLYRQLDDKGAAAYCLSYLGTAKGEQGNRYEVDALFEEGLALFREIGDKRGAARCVMWWGEALSGCGEYARGVPLLEQGVALQRELRDMPWLALALNNLGWGLLLQGNHGRASEALKESLELEQQLGLTIFVIDCLDRLAMVAGSEGRADRAARLFGASETLREVARAPLPDSERAAYDRYLTLARSQLDEPTWAAALASGRTISMDEAVRYALERTG